MSVEQGVQGGTVSPLFSAEAADLIKRVLRIDAIPGFVSASGNPTELDPDLAHALVFYSLQRALPDAATYPTAVEVLRTLYLHLIAAGEELGKLPNTGPASSSGKILRTAVFTLLANLITAPSLVAPGNPSTLNSINSGMLFTILSDRHHRNYCEVVCSGLGSLPDTANDLIQAAAVKIAEYAMRVALRSNSIEAFTEALLLVYALSSNLRIAKLLAHSRLWMISDEVKQGERKGAAMETDTLLGCMFTMGALPRDGPCQDAVLERAFPDTNDLDLNSVIKVWDDERNNFKNLSVAANNIVINFLRADKKAVITWFTQAIVLNRSARSFHTDTKNVGSPSFLYNVMQALMYLSYGMINKTPQEVGLDPWYLVKDKFGSLHESSNITFLLPQEEEKTNLEAAVAAGKTNPQETSMATEFLFLTIESIELTLAALKDRRFICSVTISRCNRELERIEREMEDANKGSFSGANGLLNYQKRRATEVKEAQLRILLSLDCLIGDIRVLRRMEEILGYTCSWMADLLEVKDPNTGLSTSFLALPEFFLTAVSLYITLASVAIEMYFDLDQSVKIFPLVVNLLGDTKHVRNPFLRSEFVKALGKLVSAADEDNKAPWIINNCSMLESSCPCGQFLVPALFRFYVSVEGMGRELGFYEKFEVRDDVHILVSHMWNQYSIKISMQEYLQSTDPAVQETFTRAGSAVISDLNFMLEDVIENIKRIASIAQERTEPIWATLSEEQRSEEISRSDEAERTVRSSASLYKNALNFFRILILEAGPQVTAVFTSDQNLVQDLANMLNYYLSELLSKDADSLVSRGQMYGFDAEELFSTIVEVMATLRNDKNIVHALWQDERSYSRNLYALAIEKMSDISRGSYPALNGFRSLVDAVAADHEKYAAEIEALKDAPDEYIDDISGVLMRDPVNIPGGAILDRSTVMRFINAGQPNPYTRGELSEQDMTPLPELKAEVEKWIEERLAQIKH